MLRGKHTTRLLVWYDMTLMAAKFSSFNINIDS